MTMVTSFNSVESSLPHLMTLTLYISFERVLRDDLFGGNMIDDSHHGDKEASFERKNLDKNSLMTKRQKAKERKRV